MKQRRPLLDIGKDPDESYYNRTDRMVWRLFVVLLTAGAICLALGVFA